MPFVRANALHALPCGGRNLARARLAFHQHPPRTSPHRPSLHVSAAGDNGYGCWFQAACKHKQCQAGLARPQQTPSWLRKRKKSHTGPAWRILHSWRAKANAHLTFSKCALCATPLPAGYPCLWRHAACTASCPTTASHPTRCPTTRPVLSLSLMYPGGQEDGRTMARKTLLLLDGGRRLRSGAGGRTHGANNIST